MRANLLNFLMIMCLAVTGWGQNEPTQCYVVDKGGQIRNHNVDFLNLLLDVKFNQQEGKVMGNATYLFTPVQYLVDTLFLDGPGIIVENIQLDGVNTNFRMDSAGITVYFNPPLDWQKNYQLSISYEAHPKRGIYFTGWNAPQPINPNDPDRMRKQIWTQGQGIDNRHWIPSYDGVNDKLITELNITFDNSYTVISNGDLVNTISNNDNTTTWHYKMPHPHPIYLIMLAIGEYEHVDMISKRGVVSRQYYYADRKNSVEPTYRYSAEMMDWMEQELKVNYPWTSYANVPVQEFLYGAMENTTATIFSDYFLQDENSYPDKNYVGINTHELTHQWFGDYVTAWSGSSHWLQESFATYYSKKFKQFQFGEDVYQWSRHEEMQTAMEADARNNKPVGHSEAGSQRVYQKGSIVLDMLRYVVGEEQFRKAITDFLATHPYQNVDSHEFEMQFMKSLGMNVNWFFDQWIYRAGFPEYTVASSEESGIIKVHVKQTQNKTATTGLHKMPVHIQAHFTDGEFIDRLVWIEKDSTDILFSTPDNKQLAFILFDPGRMVLSKVIYKREYSELRYQAFNAPNMIDRYYALFDMREVPLETKRSDLVKLYARETFHAIKSEIVFQLSGDEDKATLDLLNAAITDKNALVRRAVIQNTKSLNKKLEKNFITLLQDPNYQNVELALNKLCELNPDKKSKYLQETSGQMGSNKNIRIAWLEIACKDEKEKYIGELIAYSGPAYEFRTRVDAMNTLQNLDYCNEQLLVNLFDGACSANGRLSGPAKGALKKLMENPAIKEQAFTYYTSHFWTDYQQGRLKGLFE